MDRMTPGQVNSFSKLGDEPFPLVLRHGDFSIIFPELKKNITVLERLKFLMNDLIE